MSVMFWLYIGYKTMRLLAIQQTKGKRRYERRLQSAHSQRGRGLRRRNLVEHTAIAEVDGLSLSPPPKIGDGN